MRQQEEADDGMRRRAAKIEKVKTALCVELTAELAAAGGSKRVEKVLERIEEAGRTAEQIAEKAEAVGRRSGAVAYARAMARATGGRTQAKIDMILENWEKAPAREQVRRACEAAEKQGRRAAKKAEKKYARQLLENELKALRKELKPKPQPQAH